VFGTSKACYNLVWTVIIKCGTWFPEQSLGLRETRFYMHIFSYNNNKGVLIVAEKMFVNFILEIIF